MEFYSVKHREKIDVPEDKIKKRKFSSGEGEGRIRYAAVAEVSHKGDNVKLTKFISKVDYDKLGVPEVK
jgi:hypothetical protein